MVTDPDDSARADGVAIVTGGSHGLGREISLGLAARGYAVVVGYARDQAAADGTVDEVLAADGAALAVRADVADEIDVQRLFAETVEAFGGVDIVVHADALGAGAVNRRAAAELRAGGAVVDVSGADAVTVASDPTGDDRGELRGRGVTVNVVVPGPDRPGRAETVVDIVAFLLSDAGRGVDGQVIQADTRAPTRDLPRRDTPTVARRFMGTGPTEANMTGTDVSEQTSTDRPRPGTVDLKLEVVVLGVSDVDRAKQFYETLGFRLDADFTAGDFRVVQLTPPGSACSIIFGTGVTTAVPGSADGLMLVVCDIEEARVLVACGVDVSEVFHDAGGVFRHAGTTARVPGPDPAGRSYSSFASFGDPDGNGWVLQQITTRLPGR